MATNFAQILQKRNMKKLLLFVIGVIGLATAQSQNITNRDSRLWLGYLTQTKVNKHFSIWADAHWVSHGFGLVRPGLSYHFNNKPNIITTLGYAHLWIYPAAGNHTFRPEHRAWGQTTAAHKFHELNFFHRFRYEARFRRTIIADHLQNEFNFNYRLRYLFQTKYNFTHQADAKQKFYGLISDEVAYNFGKEIKNGFRLDQNRIAIGAGITFKNTTVQLSYLNQLLESNSSNTFSMNHHAQLLVFQNFDLRKKQ